jgi:nucleotide-binding universal stress UspA family protein
MWLFRTVVSKGTAKTRSPREHDVTSPQVERTGRIVAGVDGSPSSMAALEWAAHQAELTGSTLEVVTAWEWPMTYGVPFAITSEYDPAADAQRQVDGAVETARAGHPKVEIRATVTEGHPAPVLVKASHGAALLVVGSRGHGEFVGMLLGSVSEHCVTNAGCPVLVLRDVG